MKQESITRFIATTFAGVDVVVASKENGAPEVAWGHSFFIYDPDRNLDETRRFSFATIVTQDKGTIDALIVEGDTAALIHTATGAHKGPFLGVQPTGKRLSNAGMGFLRIADGRIAEEWLCYDGLGLMQQMGANRG